MNSNNTPSAPRTGKGPLEIGRVPPGKREPKNVKWRVTTQVCHPHWPQEGPAPRTQKRRLWEDVSTAFPGLRPNLRDVDAE